MTEETGALRAIMEETVMAGYPAGDSAQTLANVRAMRAENLRHNLAVLRSESALRPSAGAGEIEALVQRLRIEAKDRSQYAREEGMEDGESERDEETARVCTLAARVLTSLTAPAPGVQTEALTNEVERALDFFTWANIKKLDSGEDRDWHHHLNVALDHGAALSRHIKPEGAASLPAPGVREAIYEECAKIAETTMRAFSKGSLRRPGSIEGYGDEIAAAIRAAGEKP